MGGRTAPMFRSPAGPGNSAAEPRQASFIDSAYCNVYNCFIIKCFSRRRHSRRRRPRLPERPIEMQTAYNPQSSDTERLARFGEAIDAIRARVEADLGQMDVDHVERVRALSTAL